MNRVYIDETDVKLINILQEDPRTTIRQLAKDCKIAMNTAKRRYERLRKEGLIIGEMVVLHPKAFGLDCIIMCGIITKPGKEREVLDSLREKPEIIYNFVEIGRYNIRSIIGLTRFQDLGHFVDSLRKVPHVSDVDVMILFDYEGWAYPRNLVIETHLKTTVKCTSEVDENPVEVKTSSTTFVRKAEERTSSLPLSTMCPSLDKIDEGILNQLSTNARIPFSAIARQIGVSTKTVIVRYKKLKKEWIWISTLALNLRKIGYQAYVGFHIKVSSKSWIHEVYERIIQVTNVIVALKLIGRFDIFVIAPFSSPDQLMKIYRSISEISGIARIERQIGYDIHVWPAY